MTSNIWLATATLAFVSSVSAGISVAYGQEAVSEVPEILTVAITKVPEGPHPRPQDDNCTARFLNPETEAGREVQQRGWGVLSEVRVGDYQLVSFAGEFISGTSGSCAIQQGNIGVFEESRLKAILYTASKTDRLIGVLEPLEGGNVRIWGSDFLGSPVADIQAGSLGLVVQEVASEDTFCGGRVIVPNIYNADITDARSTLAAAGWEPVEQPQEEWGQQIGLHEIGITEAISCSGTGFAFCSYAYSAPKASLQVISAGELWEGSVPGVARYAVTCLHNDLEAVPDK